MLTVGFVEGIAEATASITKVFSGDVNDLGGNVHQQRDESQSPHGGGNFAEWG
jgi:hypothetical protein